ncbi:MAG TPA: HAMP domain-containing sensor histidine kinase [Dongiaceae bacterium]|jgi:signal transduction histidine kinase|nr:HAMP domain-containing sensor histidine kinase [Dongiaceae bacterium]
MTIGEFARTSIFRITISCTLAFVAALLALSGIFYFGGTSWWRDEIRETVSEEYQTLWAAYATGGTAAVKTLIEERAAPVIDEGYIYLLQAPDGAKLAGQLPAMVPATGWLDIVPPRGDEDEPFIAKGAFLLDQSFLLVGHDAHDLHDAIELVEEGIVWMLGIAVPLSLITALASSALIFRRLEIINRLSLDITQGQLDRRLPVSARNDEFDRLATHLNVMLDGIQDLTDSLRQVTNNIAHELRTPLTRIHNKVEAARRQPLAADDAKLVLDSIILELDGLLSAFGALLRIAYIDAGTLRSTFKEFELSKSMSALVEDFEPIARESGKRLSAEIAPGLRFFGDKRLIIQMVVNLLENAIAHSGSDQILLSAGSAGDGVEIRVADNGVGIPETERKMVFQRFYRLGKSGQPAGFGLGLSLVAAIAKLHRIGVALLDNGPGLQVVLSFPPLRAGSQAE